jgi:hypothetical protein
MNEINRLKKECKDIDKRLNDSHEVKEESLATFRRYVEIHTRMLVGK